jgi:hypothetical protein
MLGNRKEKSKRKYNLIRIKKGIMYIIRRNRTLVVLRPVLVLLQDILEDFF